MNSLVLNCVAMMLYFTQFSKHLTTNDGSLVHTI
jgi:hypothetical protein